MRDEKDALRSFRVPGPPPGPDALARGRNALLHHIAGSGRRRPRPHQRWTQLGAAVAATVAILAAVTGVASLGVRDHPGDARDDPSSGAVTLDTASAGGAGLVQAGRPVCPDLVTPRGEGRDIWVAADGDDRRSGATAADALATPQEAVDRAGPGDRVLLSSGTYTSGRGAVVEMDRDGEPGRYIVLTAAPGAHPVIRTGAQNWYAVRVTGSYVVVSGLTVEGHRSATDLATATAMVDENDARTGGNGIVVGLDAGAQRFPHDVVVQHNVVRDMPGGGIAALRTGSVTIECNAVSGSATLSPFGNSGISVADSRSVDPDGDVVAIRRNVVHDNDSLVPRRGSGPDPASRSVQTGHGISCDGIDATRWRGQLLVEDNLTYANGGAGINVLGCDGVLLRGNTAAQNATRPGGKLGEVTIGRSTGVEVVDNLLVPRGTVPGLVAGGSAWAVDNVATNETGVFVDAGAGDYRPRCDGPAAGKASAGMPKDLFGADRPADRAADAGAIQAC